MSPVARPLSSRWIVPPGGVGVVVQHAHLLERGGVAPRRVQVFGIDEDGPLIEPVQHLRGGLSVRHVRHPATAQDTLVLGIRGGVLLDSLSDVLQARAVGQDRLLEGLAHHQEVHVAVHEAREEEPALEVMVSGGLLEGYYGGIIERADVRDASRRVINGHRVDEVVGGVIQPACLEDAGIVQDGRHLSAGYDVVT